jgi:hypothetical protein
MPCRRSQASRSPSLTRSTFGSSDSLRYIPSRRLTLNPDLPTVTLSHTRQESHAAPMRRLVTAILHSAQTYVDIVPSKNGRGWRCRGTRALRMHQGPMDHRQRRITAAGRTFGHVAVRYLVTCVLSRSLEWARPVSNQRPPLVGRLDRGGRRYSHPYSPGGRHWQTAASADRRLTWPARWR